MSSTPFGAPSPSPFNPFAAAQPNPGGAQTASNPFQSSPKPNPFAASSAAQTNPGSTNGAFVPGNGQGPVSTQSRKFEAAAGPFSAGTNGPLNGKRKGGVDEARLEEARAKVARSASNPRNATNTSRQAPPQPRQELNHPGSRKAHGSNPANLGRRNDFAEMIYKQLAKDGIKPPAWPSNPGSRSSRAAMDAFRQQHKSYREKARQSLVKADLVDEEGKQRRLDQALVFKGICEDMCPEWEKIIRITENDVKLAEKDNKDGEMIPIPGKMVMRLARSAAGQELPLPMDVRSPAALRRSLDYMIDDLIPTDNLLPSRHHFLWDRTRAIRKDFIPQGSAMNADEIQDQIYCLETIARFHVVALHLLSQPGFASEDFSEQQEKEQLSKTLMSLDQVYDQCSASGIHCENEAEFRGYYVLFFASETGLKEKVQRWPERLWASDGVRTAMCLVECMQNTFQLHGPLNPYAPTEIAMAASSFFFSIVASAKISYTMACFAEIHFGMIRQSILKMIKKAYSRPRDGPKDLTPEFLRRKLHFDTEDEAISFAELHGLDFAQVAGNRYLVLDPRQPLEEPRVPHAFSHELVERKRSGKPLPDVIHYTIYEAPQEAAFGSQSPEESLFVQDSAATPNPKRVPENLVEAESEAEGTLPYKTAKSMFAQGSEASGFGGKTKTLPGTSIFSQPTSAASPIFSQPAPTTTSPSTFPSTTTETSQPAKNPFGHLFGANKSQPSGPPSQQQQTEVASPASKNEKRVSFGPNTYVEFVQPAPESNVSPDPFGFLRRDAAQGSDLATGASGSRPPLPPNSLPPTDSAAGGGGSRGSLFTGATGAMPSSGFQFTSSNNSATAYQPTASSSPGSIFANSSSTQPQLLPTAAANNEISAPYSSPTTTSKNPPSATIFGGSTAAPHFSSVATDLTASNTVFSQPSAPANAGSLSAPSSSSQTPANKDMMADFTRWFVLADHGLMEDHLQEAIIEQLLSEAWEKHSTEEDERRRKEEDDRSWAEAHKFRNRSLSVTYFYRWLDVFRKRRVKKRILMEKEKFRQWNSPENVAARKAEKEARKEEKHRAAIDLLRQRNTQEKQTAQALRESVRSRNQDVEDALLASGIFNGVHNERASARDAVEGSIGSTSTTMLPSEMLLRTENRRREKRGLKPISRLPTPLAKEGSKTAKLRALSNGQDAMSISTSSFRNSAFSSSYRSSLGVNSSRVEKAKKSRVKDPYWQFKAHGLVLMDDGRYAYQPEALEKLRQSQRPSEQFSMSPSRSPAGTDLANHTTSLLLEDARGSRVSSSPSVTSRAATKRKRPPLFHREAEEDDEDEDLDLAEYRTEASAAPSRKRAKSGSGEPMDSDADFLAQMNGLLQEVEEERRRLGK